MKTFKEYLAEMPTINKYHTKEFLRRLGKPVYDYIEKNHNSAKSIGKDHFHLKISNGADIYYHHDGVSAKEMSYINNDSQVGVDKNSGDTSHIHSFMRHHIDTNGKLKSDSSNTEGSKKLWKTFIKNNKDLKYHYVDDKTGIKTEVNSDNIDNHESKIWGDSDKFRDLKIVAEK